MKFRKDAVGYYMAHHRVIHVRGKAKLHLCVDCGATALDWSYQGGDPNELTQETGARSGITYSLEPAYYAPRCRPCHREFDHPKQPCAVEQCQSIAYCHGWCEMHYTRWKRHGDPTVNKNNRKGFIDGKA